jgi:magnesium transporter
METLNVIYVTDERGHLIDDLRIREILIRPVSTVISSFRDSTFTSLQASDQQGDALEIFRKYDRNTLPVVDQSGHLLGIVTIDDMLDVQEEETTEDIQKLGGVEALEDPYMDSSIFALVKKRAVWLVLLFIGEMFTATAMGFFEHQLERAVMLALFIPLIISAGGNAGSQATSLLIRAMALGEVHARDWWRVMRREIASGLALGLLLGLIGFARIALWGQFSTIYGPHYLLLGATVGITVLGVVLWGTLAGSMFPILLRRLGLDPATSSAPFVATLVDVTGLVIYFSVALLLLRGTVL